MTAQPATMNDETIETFRRIRDLAVNPYNDAYKSLHEIGSIVFKVLLDHAPEFEFFREYVEKHERTPK